MPTNGMLHRLETLVNQESGTYNKQGVDRVGETLTKWFSDLGYVITEDVQQDRGNNLIGYYKGAKDAKIIVLAHMDTVFKEGTVNVRPFSKDEQYAYGPGVFDMKASIVVLYEALVELKNEQQEELLENVAILFNSDEEVGSIHSRAWIEEHAREKSFALILEPTRDKQRVCNARKGGGKYYLHLYGKASHAGMAHRHGESAVEELALLIPRLHVLTDYDEGVTVNVGLIEGGTSVNTIAPYAYAGIDLRMETIEQAEQFDKLIRAQIAKRANSEITYELESRSGISRPPFVPDEGSEQLLRYVQEVGKNMGWDIEAEKTGGGSDGNLTSYIGIPTIDGLGPVGGNAHQEDEYVDISSLEERKEFLKALLLRLTDAAKK